MADLYLEKVNETYFRVHCEEDIAHELNETLTFFVKNYKYHPKVRAKKWDGKIRLYSLATRLIYCGLLNELIKFCLERDYTIKADRKITDFEFSEIEANDFISSLNIPDRFEKRDYQVKCFIDSVRKRRQTNLLATSAGKSIIIYWLTRFYDTKTLIIVPTINLVEQMSKDFFSYGFKGDIHKITAGIEKETNKNITISTWQSLQHQPKSFFKQFKLVICDEVHLATANSIKSIMENLISGKYRFGFTGTTDDLPVHEMVLNGLFGPLKRYIKASELIEQGYASTFEIKSIVLKYNDTISKLMYENAEINKKKPAQVYQEEIDFIVRYNKRNEFIKNLTLSLQGNTLLLFQFVAKHGEVLYKLIKDQAKNRNVYYIAGLTEKDIREDIRQLVEKETNAIIVASVGTSSTGISIVNLHNIIFSSPTKSKIRTLQSIGRMLRKGGSKISATLYDIADDMTWEDRENYSYKHFRQRLFIYKNESFPIKVYNVEL